LLPRLKEAAAAKAATVEVLPTGSERILFVDDEEALADLAKEMLETFGYHVITQTSSLAALETFRAAPEACDLVITDLTMPGLTGIELAKKVTAIRADISVILCTGFSDHIDQEKVREAGISEFVMKPYQFASLAGTIRRVLDRAKNTREAPEMEP
jgi:DNA-binding response OmpR family regulator